MRILFWNLKSRLLLDLLTALVDEHSPDILVLAECSIDGADLLSAA